MCYLKIRIREASKPVVNIDQLTVLVKLLPLLLSSHKSTDRIGETPPLLLPSHQSTDRSSETPPHIYSSLAVNQLTVAVKLLPYSSLAINQLTALVKLLPILLPILLPRHQSTDRIGETPPHTPP